MISVQDARILLKMKNLLVAKTFNQEKNVCQCFPSDRSIKLTPQQILITHLQILSL